MQNRVFNEVVFRHLVRFPSFNCVFCSTEETETGKTKLYLVFNQRKKVFHRNGLNETWDLVKNEAECDSIREGFDTAIREQVVPCYSA